METRQTILINITILSHTSCLLYENDYWKNQLLSWKFQLNVGKNQL